MKDESYLTLFGRLRTRSLTGSTPGSALPSIASCFRLVTILLADPQNTDSQLDPSWFGLRPFPRVKGSYLRLDIKGPESMPDGMGFHLPMKLREQNSRSQRKTRIQFSCIPQVAPRHRGNDCQIRWNLSVGSLFIITVASTLNGRINATSQGCKNTDVDRPRRCAAAL